MLADATLDRVLSAVRANLRTAGIELRFDLSRRGVFRLPADATTTAGVLHTAIARLTGNSPFAPRVERIALILADRFEGGAGVLGVMFDRGFNVPGETAVGSRENLLPREGCAVFLDAIRAARHAEDVEAEIEYTTTHELGHVFNLWHTGTPPSFMTPSCQNRSHPRTTFLFRPDQLSFLSQHDADHVRPGGWRFGTRSNFGPASDESHQCSGGAPEANGRRLAFDIRIARRSFWPFEPVELEVTLRRAGRGPAFEIPDKIDPGYDEFRIWIREPNGAVRRYQSPRVYCSNNAVRRIAFRQPFRRDISIFGEAGGYTFQQHGAHNIWCELRLGSIAMLSNRLRVNVKAPQASLRYQDLRHCCTHPEVASLLFHRRAVQLTKECRDLLDRLDALFMPHCAASATLQYTIGRNGASDDSVQRLQRALSSQHLSAFQRRVAKSTIAGLASKSWITNRSHTT